MEQNQSETVAAKRAALVSLYRQIARCMSNETVCSDAVAESLRLAIASVNEEIAEIDRAKGR